MKIAICGGGPLGIEMGLLINHWGGDFKIFSSQSLGSSFLKLVNSQWSNETFFLSWSEITSPWGREYIEGHLKLKLQFSVEDDEKNGQIFPTIKDYWEKYLKILIDNGPFFTSFGQCRVLRVHKRFVSLNQDEGRFKDLFRVVYERDPSLSLEEQIKENPEHFKNFHKEIMNSLHSKIENFEDFDMVVDATGVIQNPLPMGPGHSLAVGELRGIESQKIIYPHQLSFSLQKMSFEKRIVIVGSGETALREILTLQNFEPNFHLIMVTEEEAPFASLKKRCDHRKKLLDLWDELLKVWTQQDKENQRVYEERLKDFESLDDFIKVKKKKPEFPKKIFECYTSSYVTAVDKLDDLNDIFITIEKHPNELNFFKTISCDYILLACGYNRQMEPFKSLRYLMSYDKKKTLSINGTHPEPGFYTIGSVCDASDRYNLKDGITQMLKLEKIILSYFTKVH